MPEPLHPAVVHLPLGLAVVVPWLTLAAVIAIVRKALPLRVWWGVVALNALLAASALFAAETGEDERDDVLQQVAAEHVDAHESKGESLFRLAMLTAIVAAVGLLRDRWGLWARAFTVVLSLGVLVLAIQTGKSGGSLVYEHGAAAVYQRGK